MRTIRKILWLWLIAAGLMILAFPGQLSAQKDEVRLSLRLLPDYYYTEIAAGEETTLYLEIRNDGSQAVTDIRLDCDKPKGWIVEFRPDSIGYLGAGSYQTIDVNVVPAPDTDRGKYTLTLIAEANETRTATSTILRVENTFSFWLWVGVGVGVVVLAGFVILYLRFGRE